VDYEVAIKMEHVSCHHPQINKEVYVLTQLQGGVGVPKFYKSFNFDEYNILVMEYLGPSIEDLFNICHRKFSLKTVLMLADQLIRRIEYIHEKNFIHRDIKPENFLIGRKDKNNLIYMIDFGLSKKYIDISTNLHIPFTDTNPFVGNSRYSSLNNHMGYEQSRRDDLESLGYLFSYLIYGSLPWQGISANTKDQKYRRIKECKISTPISDIVPEYSEFEQYMKYCRNLKFSEDPDYSYLRNIFRKKIV